MFPEFPEAKPILRLYLPLTESNRVCYSADSPVRVILRGGSVQLIVFGAPRIRR